LPEGEQIVRKIMKQFLWPDLTDGVTDLFAIECLKTQIRN
jgi:hypothetical protein